MNNLDKPWLITPAGFSRLAREDEKRKALKPGATAIDLVIESPREASCLDDNGIAHIFISGVIGHRLDWIDKALGNTDVCDIRRELDAAVTAGANGIFLRVDSPGGAITGGAEVASYIAEIDVSIPVFAYGDACIASMAYWLSSGARQIWTSPTAEVGSIGIFLPWIDKSMAWNALGISFEPFTNAEGIYKSAGHGPSLTPEQREQMQSYIDRIFSLFHGFVTQRRPQLDSSAMQGQTFLGCDAQLYGLADGTGSIEQAYSALCLEAGVFPVDVPLDQYIPFSFGSYGPLAEAGHDVSDEARDDHGRFASGGGGSEGANPKDGAEEDGEENEPSLSPDEQSFIDFYEGDKSPENFWSADGVVESGALTEAEVNRGEELHDSIESFDKDDVDSWPLSDEDKEKANYIKSFVDEFDKDDSSTYPGELQTKYDDLDEKSLSVDSDDPDSFPDDLKSEASRLKSEWDATPETDGDKLDEISGKQDRLVEKAEKTFEKQRDQVKRDAVEEYKQDKQTMKDLTEKAREALTVQKEEYEKLEDKARAKFNELKSKDNGARD